MEIASYPDRVLTELVLVEYQVLVAKAFGYTPKEEAIRTYVNQEEQAFILTDQQYTLTIWSDGQMMAGRNVAITDDVIPAKFNPSSVLYQLIVMGVDLSATLIPKTPADRKQELERALALAPGPCPTQEIEGTQFAFKLLPSNLPAIDNAALDHLLSTAWHWTNGESLHQLVTLDDFSQKLHQELYWMGTDKMDISGIQIQWLDSQHTLTIASKAVPVTIYATISLTSDSDKEVNA